MKEIKTKIVTATKVGCGFATIWYAYWIFYVEMVVYNKTLYKALGVTPLNNIGLVASIGLFVVLSSKTLQKMVAGKAFDAVQPKKTLFQQPSAPQPIVEPERKNLTSNQIREVSTRPTTPIMATQPAIIPQPHVPKFKYKVERREKRKIRVPGLRQMKRFLAAGLLLFYVAMAVSTLMMAGGQMLMALFLLTVFIFVDYLSKTRGRDKLELVEREALGGE